MRSLIRSSLLLVAATSLVHAQADKAAPQAKEKPPVPAKAAAGAPAQPAPAPPPPEVKKTVDAFTGTWTFDGNLTMPGAAAPVKVKETFTCKKVAGGRVVSCTGSAKVPGMGKMEDVALVTYDAEGKKVRFVGMNSMGEVHDHACTWKDDKSLGCEPLHITAMGAPATVTLEMSWTDPKNAKLNETTTMKDGSKMSFDGVGKRK